MKVLGRIGIAAVISAAMAVLASPALACSIMPPPPPPQPAAGTPEADVVALNQAWGMAHGLKYSEELREWAMRRQVGLFDDARGLVLMRYDREGKAGEDTLAILKPVRWLKGRGVAAELRIGMTQPPPCGQMTAHDAYYGKPGDVFLVYLSGTTLQQENVLEAFALDRIIEPRTIAALTTAPQ
jgi:hypothetical protein